MQNDGRLYGCNPAICGVRESFDSLFYEHKLDTFSLEKNVVGCDLLTLKLFNNDASSEANGFTACSQEITKLIDLMLWTHPSLFYFAQCRHQ
jgi:hypothetical protein